MKSCGFVCEHCGHEVKTSANHCPQCLWSKHTTGSKGKACHGAMQPVGISFKEEQCTITHRCVTCGVFSRRKTVVHDNFEALSKLSIDANEVLSQVANTDAA